MRLFIWHVVIVVGLAFVVTVQASAIGNKTDLQTLQTVLMMSDTHFNPFHDPAKVKQLVEAPAGKWEEVLASPDSPTQAQDFEALRIECKLRGIDTPYSLFTSAIQAIHRDAAEA